VARVVRVCGVRTGIMVWDISLAEQNNFGQQVSQWLKSN
jgi:hypothetical protein